jgi:hypothetical protein
MKKSVSKGHREVLEILTEAFPLVKIRQEFSVDVYDSFNRKHVLFFDFFIEVFSIAIEVQGRQHFQHVGFFHGEGGLAKQKLNDRLKREWCIENDVALITVDYDETISKDLMMRKIKDAIS